MEDGGIPMDCSRLFLENSEHQKDSAGIPNKNSGPSSENCEHRIKNSGISKNSSAQVRDNAEIPVGRVELWNFKLGICVGNPITCVGKAEILNSRLHKPNFCLELLVGRVGISVGLGDTSARPRSNSIVRR